MEKVVYEEEADCFEALPVAEMIEWLDGILTEQPSDAPPLMFEIHQFGDYYDGYSAARLRIFREETPQESAVRHAASEAVQRELNARRIVEAEERDRAEFERLRAKYGA